MMDWEFLRFLSDPAFLLAWYGFGVAAAGWVVYDTFTANRNVMAALKAAWPINCIFFSVLGLVFSLTYERGRARS